MKKLKILALQLNYGGIESCICNVANLLCDFYDIEIISIYKLLDHPAFKLDERIKVTYLTENIKPNGNEFKTAFKHLNFIKCFFIGLKSLHILYLKRHTLIKAVKESDGDIFLSTRIYINKILGRYGHGVKIGWEHNHHHNDQKYIKTFMSSCQNLDKVILVSKSLKDYYEKLFTVNNLSCNCIYIPNFIDILPENKTNFDNKNLISVGRLSLEKGFIDLIDVYKLVDLGLGDTHLDIIGDGSEATNINNKIIDYNLTRKITMHGFQDKDYINNQYLNSALYLMTSYTESFGLVLIEAMAYGIPCIAYDSAEGANDIIQNNYNGYLIKNRNEHDMADAVIKLLSNRAELKRLSNNARQTALKYTASSFKDKWLEVLGDK